MFGLSGKKRGGWFLKALAACIILAACFSAFKRLYPLERVALVEKYAAAYSLEPALVCAVINAESGFRADAASHKGAAGLMQITEPTAVWLAEKIGLENFEYGMIYDPEVNIHIGCYYISRLFEKYHGDGTLALAAYNAGEGTVAKWLADPRYSVNGETLSDVPFKETRNYIRRVTFNTKVYRALLKLYGENND